MKPEQSNLLDIIDYISNSNATERLEAQRIKVREGNGHIEEKTLDQHCTFTPHKV